MPVSRGEKALTIELMVAGTLRTWQGLRDKELVGPEHYASLVLVYGGLGIPAAFSPRWAEVAGGFGGLVLLAIFLESFSGTIKKVVKPHPNPAPPPPGVHKVL